MNATEEKAPRTRGTGSIFVRPGSCNYYVAYYSASGKQVQESAKSSILAVAERLLRKRLEEVEKGVPVEEVRRLKYEDVKDLLITDYRNRNVGMLEEREGEPYVWGFDHLEYFKGMKVFRISTAVLSKFVEHRKSEGAGNATINRNLALLRKMMNLAKRAGMLPAVPWFPMLGEDNVRQGFVDVEGFKAILIRLPENLRPLAVFLYYTGCRVGAALKITWDMVSSDCRTMTLPGSIVKNKEPLTVAVPAELQTVFKSQFRVSGAKVFDAVNLRKEWAKAAPGVLIHDLRRSGIRNLVNGGVPETVAMRISGHKTASVFRRYAIVSTEDIAKAMKKVSAGFDCSPIEVKARKQAAGK